MTAKKAKTTKLEIRVDREEAIARVTFGAEKQHALFADGEDEGAQDGEGAFSTNPAKAMLRDNVSLIEGMLLNLPNVWAIVRDEQTRDYVALDAKQAEIARDPELEDLFTTLTEGGEDEEDGEERSGTVVPDKFKKLYAEASKERGGVDCGDWLADQLAKFCLVPVKEGRKKLVTDVDRFVDICTANGVDGKKLDALRTGNRGWQGRLRMTGRNLLTPIIASKGVLFVPAGHGAKDDTEVKAPKQWCLDNAPKPKAEKKSAAKAAVPAKGQPKAEAAKPAKAPAKRTRKAKEAA